MELSEEIKTWFEETNKGLMEEKIEIVAKGVSGTYFCNDKSGNKVAVFKPFDEEALAPNNPKSDDRANSSTGLIEGTKVGRGAAREVAAYLLDHPTKDERRQGFTGQLMGFCGVPPTIPISCLSRYLNYPKNSGVSYEHVGYYKFGSLQMFMENEGDCYDKNPQPFSMEEVHKICLLDIRFSNVDRHLGNLLFRKDENGEYKLIPIDHGYCFPENFKERTFDWLNWGNWPRENFNQEFIDYIDSLNPEVDIDILIRNHFIMSFKFARTLHISTMLLQKGVKKGLTPYKIGHFMCEEFYGKKSILEMVVSEAIEKVIKENLGEEAIADKIIIKKAEEESELEGMSKAEFEKKLLDAVSIIMETKLDEYANEL